MTIGQSYQSMVEVALMVTDTTLYYGIVSTSIDVHKFGGRLLSPDWTSELDGLDWWTGLVDWTSRLDWWTGLVDWTGGLTLNIVFMLLMRLTCL